MCWFGQYSFEACCDTTTSATGWADCWFGSWNYDTCLCAPPQDCAGAWSACDSSCLKTFTVTQASVSGGAACEAADGASTPCSAGEGACPASGLACSGVIAPPEGSLGTCTGILLHGAACNLACDSGYRVTGDQPHCLDGVTTNSVICAWGGWPSCWSAAFSYETCCDTATSAAGWADCWFEFWNYETCWCALPLPCVGAWSACGTSCLKTFQVTQPAVSGGISCVAADGATASCLPGDGQCLSSGSSCSGIATPLHATAGTCTGTLAHGTSCDMTCDAGYHVSGDQPFCVDGTAVGVTMSCVWRGSAACWGSPVDWSLYELCCVNGGSCWGGSYTHAFCCPERQDCVGGWGACDTNCDETYAVSVATAADGTTCPHLDGDVNTQALCGSLSHCPTDCSGPLAPANALLGTCTAWVDLAIATSSPYKLAHGASCSLSCENGYQAQGQEPSCDDGVLTQTFSCVWTGARFCFDHNMYVLPAYQTWSYCCDTTSSATGNAVCWDSVAGYDFDACECVEQQPCAGLWLDCDASCERRYSITSAAISGGAACEAVDNALDISYQCGGSGTCSTKCTLNFHTAEDFICSAGYTAKAGSESLASPSSASNTDRTATCCDRIFCSTTICLSTQTLKADAGTTLPAAGVAATASLCCDDVSGACVSNADNSGDLTCPSGYVQKAGAAGITSAATDTNTQRVQSCCDRVFCSAGLCGPGEVMVSGAGTLPGIGIVATRAQCCHSTGHCTGNTDSSVDPDVACAAPAALKANSHLVDGRTSAVCCAVKGMCIGNTDQHRNWGEPDFVCLGYSAQLRPTAALIAGRSQELCCHETGLCTGNSLASEDVTCTSPLSMRPDAKTALRRNSPSTVCCVRTGLCQNNDDQAAEPNILCPFPAAVKPDPSTGRDATTCCVTSGACIGNTNSAEDVVCMPGKVLVGGAETTSRVDDESCCEAVDACVDVTCAAPAADSCQVGGLCQRGVCVATIRAADGSTCDDGDPLTLNDICNSGATNHCAGKMALVSAITFGISPTTIPAAASPERLDLERTVKASLAAVLAASGMTTVTPADIEIINVRLGSIIIDFVVHVAVSQATPTIRFAAATAISVSTMSLTVGGQTATGATVTPFASYAWVKTAATCLAAGCDDTTGYKWATDTYTCTIDEQASSDASTCTQMLGNAPSTNIRCCQPAMVSSGSSGVVAQVVQVAQNGRYMYVPLLLIVLAVITLVGACVSAFYFRKQAGMQVKPIAASQAFGEDGHQQPTDSVADSEEEEGLTAVAELVVVPPTVDAKQLRAQTMMARTMKGDGDITGAAALYRTIAEDCSAALGPVHVDTLKAMYNLANALNDCALAGSDDGSEARSLYETVVPLLEAELGPNDNDTCKAQRKLAELLAAAGEGLASQKLFADAIAGWKVLLGPNHGRVLLTSMQLAALLAEDGEIKEARKMMEDTLPLLKFLGEDAPDTLRARSQYARFLQTQDDELVLAKAEFEAVLVGWSKLRGDTGTPDVEEQILKAKMALVELLKEQGDMDAAKTILNEVVASMSQSSSEDTLAAQVATANLLKQLGDNKGAREQYERVLAASTKQHGAFHEETLNAQAEVARLLKSEGKASEAWRVFEKVVGGYTEAFGPNHPKTLKAQLSLAILLKDEKDLSDGLRQWSKQLFTQVIAGFTARYGTRHKDTLTAQANFANLLHLEGDLEQAKDLYINVVEGWRQQLGAKNPRTTRAMQNLNAIEKGLKKSKKAKGSASASQPWQQPPPSAPPPPNNLAAIRAKSAATIARIGVTGVQPQESIVAVDLGGDNDDGATMVIKCDRIAPPEAPAPEEGPSPTGRTAGSRAQAPPRPPPRPHTCRGGDGNQPPPPLPPPRGPTPPRRRAMEAEDLR